MEERNLQKNVEKWLSDRNIWYLKVWGNGIQKSGIPDLLLCVNGHFVAVELKASEGKITTLQKFNLRKITDNNGISIVLFPSGLEAFKAFIEKLKDSMSQRLKEDYEIFA